MRVREVTWSQRVVGWTMYALTQQMKEFSKCGQSKIIKSAGRNEKHEEVVEM